MLDRRLVQDDWRGLNEGVKDNAPVTATFFLAFEAQHKRSQVRCKYPFFTNYIASFVFNVLFIKFEFE